MHFAVIESPSAVQRNECCLAEWAVVNGVAAQLMVLLLISRVSTPMLVPDNESLDFRMPLKKILGDTVSSNGTCTFHHKRHILLKRRTKQCLFTVN